VTAETVAGDLGPFAQAKGIHPNAPLPELFRVHQRLDDTSVGDIDAAVAAALAPVRNEVKPGMQIALTAGSRGIANIAVILRAAGRVLKSYEAEPFIVPAMGSHGGATFTGQREVLSHIGVTEETTEMSIRGSDELVELGQVPDGPRVVTERTAFEADRILVINRIKPHTDFHGDIESGLAKILAIGLGKQPGASDLHIAGPDGLGRHIAPAAQRVVASGKVLGGLAILENALHDTRRVVFVEAEEIGGAAEAALLKEADASLARLPFPRLEVLVVGEIGKDKSGTGMDPNVIGRMRIEGVADAEEPKIAIICVLGLSEGSGGNGLGLGLGDITTHHAISQLDLYTTYVNTLTSGLGGIGRSSIPLALETEKDAITAALAICGERDPAKRRLCYIDDTLALSDFIVSSSLLDAVESDDRLGITEALGPMTFDAAGSLVR
jgi:hypothetical protein